MVLPTDGERPYQKNITFNGNNVREFPEPPLLELTKNDDWIPWKHPMELLSHVLEDDEEDEIICREDSSMDDFPDDAFSRKIILIMSNKSIFLIRNFLWNIRGATSSGCYNPAFHWCNLFLHSHRNAYQLLLSTISTVHLWCIKHNTGKSISFLFSSGEAPSEPTLMIHKTLNNILISKISNYTKISWLQCIMNLWLAGLLINSFVYLLATEENNRNCDLLVLGLNYWN